MDKKFFYKGCPIDRDSGRKNKTYNVRDSDNLFGILPLNITVVFVLA